MCVGLPYIYLHLRNVCGASEAHFVHLLTQLPTKKGISAANAFQCVYKHRYATLRAPLQQNRRSALLAVCSNVSHELVAVERLRSG